MKIKFNTVLGQMGLNPSGVLLFRHVAAQRYAHKYPSVYDIWHTAGNLWYKGGNDFYEFLENRPQGHRSEINTRPFLAHFVKDPAGETLFVCVVEAQYRGPSRVHNPNAYDLYNITPQPAFFDLEGKLFIEWGEAKVTWCQRAANQDKDIIELRR